MTTFPQVTFGRYKQGSDILVVTFDPFEPASVTTVTRALPEWVGFHAVIFRPITHWRIEVRDRLYDAARELFVCSFGDGDGLEDQICITGRVSFRDECRIKVGFRSSALTRIFDPGAFLGEYVQMAVLVPVVPKAEPVAV